MIIRTLKRLLLGCYDTVGLSNKPTRDDWVSSRLARIPPNESLLDAGAGECQYRKYCSHLRYTPQDFGQYDGQGNGRGLQTAAWDNSQLAIVSDITAIPVPDASFDNVLCTEVLEHVPDPVKALAEITRVLKPGGRLLATAPFCSFTHFAPFHFSTGFSEYWWRKHLSELGYEIHQLVPNGNLYEYVGQEMRRCVNAAGQYGGRPATLLERVAFRMMLGFLQANSSRCAASNELCVFGYHVVGQKRVSLNPVRTELTP